MCLATLNRCSFHRWIKAACTGSTRPPLTSATKLLSLCETSPPHTEPVLCCDAASFHLLPLVEDALDVRQRQGRKPAHSHVHMVRKVRGEVSSPTLWLSPLFLILLASLPVDSTDRDSSSSSTTEPGMVCVLRPHDSKTLPCVSLLLLSLASEVFPPSSPYSKVCLRVSSCYVAFSKLKQ